MLECMQNSCRCESLSTYNIIVVCLFSLLGLMLIILTALAFYHEYNKNRKEKGQLKTQLSKDEALRLWMMYNGGCGKNPCQPTGGSCECDFSLDYHETRTDGNEKTEITLKINAPQNGTNLQTNKVKQRKAK